MGHFQPRRRRSAPIPTSQPPPPAAPPPPLSSEPPLTFFPTTNLTSTPALSEPNQTTNYPSGPPRLVSVPAPPPSKPPPSANLRRPNPHGSNALSDSTRADLQFLYNLIDFLVQHRPLELQPYLRASLELYRNNFAHNKRGRPRTPGPSTPVARAPNTSNVQSQQPTRDIPQREPDIDPPAAPTAPIPEQRVIADGPSPPRLFLHAAPQPSNNPKTTASREDTVSKKVSNSTPRNPPKGPLPCIPHQFYERRAKHAKAVKERFKALTQDKLEAPLPVDDNKDYIIFKSTHAGITKPVILRAEDISHIPQLLDPNQQLLVSYAQALRFLWVSLVAKRCTGAIFYHTIGLPTMHIVLIFCHLFAKAALKKKILIICPSCNRYQWHAAARELLNLLKITFTDINTWPRDVLEWAKLGGVLVCTLDHYEKIVLSEDSDESQDIFREIVSPGPDVIVLDEASRIPTFHTAVRRMISRTCTKSRLALTAAPITADLFRTWSIADWVSPEFLGTREEFLHVYLKTIIAGQHKSSTKTDREKSFTLAQHLYSKMNHISHRLDAEVRTNTLRLQGKRLLQTTFHVNISQSHAKVYKAIAEFLSKALAKDEVSSYIVGHVLMMTCSSLEALIQLLEDGPSEGLEACKDSKIGPSLKNVEILFSDLLGLVRPLIADGEVTSKLILTKEIVSKCTSEGEKVAIFTSFSQTLSAVYTVMKDTCFPDTIKFDLSEDPDTRKKKLEKFNTCESSAVFVAPFSSSLNCTEATGWGHINADRVIIFDSCWNNTAVSQPVHRVFTFSGAAIVHVYQILCVGTLESEMKKSRGALTANASLVDGTNRGNPAVNVNNPQAYLIFPEFCRDALQGVTLDSEQRSAMDPSDNDTEDVDREVALGDDKVVDVDELRNLRMDSDVHIISKVQSRGSRFQLDADALENLLRPIPDPWEEHEGEKLFVQEVKNQIWKDTEAATGYTDRSGLLDVRHKLLDLDGVKAFFTEPGLKDGALVTCWDPYFRLYELPKKQAKPLKPSQPSEPRRKLGNVASENAGGRNRRDIREHEGQHRTTSASFPPDNIDVLARTSLKRNHHDEPPRKQSRKKRRSRGRGNGGFSPTTPPRQTPPPRPTPQRTRPPPRDEGMGLNHGAIAPRGRGRGRELTIPAWKRNMS